MTQPTDRPGIDQLRNLADRTSRGALTAEETARLRAGIDHLQTQLEYVVTDCNQLVDGDRARQVELDLIIDASVAYQRDAAEQKQRAEQAEADLARAAAAIGRIRALHAEGHDGRCESCGVRWPCLNICRLNTPPGCRNCEEWHTPAAVLDQHGQTPA